MKKNKGGEGKTKFFKKILTLVSVWLVLIYLIIPIHEWGHLMTIRRFGGDGYIVYTVFGGYVEWITVSNDGLWWCYFAGGFLTFLVYLSFWALARGSKISWAICFEVPLISIALTELVVAFLEACIYPSNPILINQLNCLSVLGLLVGIGIEWKRLRQWLIT